MPPLITWLGELITLLLRRAFANFFACLRAFMRFLAMSVTSGSNKKGGQSLPPLYTSVDPRRLG